MKINNAVICAAGLGSRLELDMPKCLVEVGGRKIISYLLEVLKDVPNIRVVVGFKEQDVIDTVRKIRKDVVFVRNPDYMNTSNSYSLYLGSKDFDEPFLNIDGDMLIKRSEFAKFCKEIEEGKDLIAVSHAYTEDAVFAKLNEQSEVIEFSRNKISNLEWTGIAYFATIRIRKEGKYVYQELESKLPIKACEIECFEVDTPSDLEYVSNRFNFDD